MNRKKYYRLLEEYNEIISKKQFNAYLCDQSELEKIKEQLVKEIRKFITYVTAEMILEEKRLAKAKLPFEKPLKSSRSQWMQEKRNKLGALHQKIQREESLLREEYENTYSRPLILSGHEVYMFMVWLVTSVVVAIGFAFTVRWLLLSIS